MLSEEVIGGSSRRAADSESSGKGAFGWQAITGPKQARVDERCHGRCEALMERAVVVAPVGEERGEAELQP